MESKPELVYHYTDVDTMMKIVKGRTLWATAIDYLNDTTERTHYLSHIKRRLKMHHLPKSCGSQGIPGKDSIFSALLDSRDDEIELGQFVASFSTLEDSLTQWRSYCPRGNGVAIAFRVDCLRAAKAIKSGAVDSLDENEAAGNTYSDEANPGNYDASSDFEATAEPPPTFSLPGVSFRKVEYVADLPTQSQSIPNSLAVQLDRDIKETLDQAAREGWLNVVGMRPTASQIFKEVIKIKASFKKHESFESEHEYRLLIDAPWWLQDFYEFKAKGSSLYPYIPVFIPDVLAQDDASDIARTFIDRVVIGPTPNMKLSKVAVESFFKKQQLKHVNVFASKVPFRDW